MSKSTRVRIICGVVAAILVAVLIAGNILLNTYSYLLHQFLSSDTTDYGGAEEELAEGDELVQQLGEESIVLLKNEDNFLPLSEEQVNQGVNLFGWTATDQGFIVVGGGSGGTVIDEKNKVTLTKAFEKEKFPYNEALLESYSAISSVDADKNSNNPSSTDALTNPDAGWYKADKMNQAKNFSNIAVVVLGRFSGENASNNELVSVGGYTGGT